MTWVRLDDSVMSHPKMLTLDPLSFSLWVGGLAYANRHATDGAIPERALWGLVPGAWKVTSRALAAAAKAVVDASLWSRTETGWSIVNYSSYQEEALSERVEERREANKQHKRAEREREKQRKSGACQVLTHADSQQSVRPDKALTVRSNVSACQSLTGPVSSGDLRADTASSRAEEAEQDTSTGRAEAEQRPSRGRAEAKNGTVNMPFLQGNMPLSQGPVPSRPVPTRPTVANATDARVTMTADRARAALEDEWRKSGKPLDSGLLVLASKSPVFALVEMYPDEAQLRSVAAAFLRDEDEWLVKSKHPLAWLAKNSTRYVETRGPNVRPNTAYQNRTMTGAELFATGGQ